MAGAVEKQAGWRRRMKGFLRWCGRASQVPCATAGTTPPQSLGAHPTVRPRGRFRYARGRRRGITMGVYGTRLFGQADRVAGLFSVRTKFFHINFVPLFPLASYLVFEQAGSSQPRGVELKKLRWNSVLLAWLRTPLWIACA